MSKILFVGYIISSESSTSISVLNGYLSVENGKITNKGTFAEFLILNKAGLFNGFNIIKLERDQFLIPGFVDCHVHAPQFPNLGVGLDRPLLEWLEKYTFPLEKMYAESEFATKVYDQVVPRLLKSGTTTACYFGSLHLCGTLQLVESIREHGQRALVGKVSMNVKNDAGYFNETEKESEDIETFIQHVINMENNLIDPVITPRFALSCDEDLMKKLGLLAEKYDCRIQSHISENLGEVKCVLNTFPNARCYAEVYEKCKLLTDKCIMAHAIYLSDEEMKIFSRRDVAVAHCPASNTRLMSGLCPVRKLLNNNIKVGLGTDVSGGDSASILDAIRRCMDVSAHLQLTGNDNAALSWKEAFYLATLGGARALRLDEKIGNFAIGKEFDALLIDLYANDSPIDFYEYSIEETEQGLAESLLQRFLYLGDDRNIKQVYVNGQDKKTVN